MRLYRTVRAMVEPGRTRPHMQMALLLAAFTFLAAPADPAAAVTPYLRSVQFEWTYFKQKQIDFDIPPGSTLVLEYVAINALTSADARKDVIYPAIELSDNAGAFYIFVLPVVSHFGTLNGKDARRCSQAVTLRPQGSKFTVILNQNKDLPWEEVGISLSGHLETP